jgi:Fe-S cluster assembly protein SufD
VSQGLPHRRIEEWKYTDLRGSLKEVYAPAIQLTGNTLSAADVAHALGPLASLDAHRLVFVDGIFQPGLSEARRIAGLDVTPLGEALSAPVGSTIANLVGTAREPDAVTALNTAFMTDGAVIQVADGAAVGKPIVAVFVRTGREQQLITQRNMIRVGAGAAVTIIEAFVSLPNAQSDGQWNALTEISTGDKAAVTHVKCVTENGRAVHLANWNASVGAQAIYRPFQLTAGVGLARNQLFVRFAGESADLDLSGVFLGRKSEHIDTTLLVDHAVPGCRSRELFKGVLDGHARGIFQGKLIVRPDAQKTDGKQMAQALMLSPDAEFDSKPELEIFADDVACGHGSTCAEIDPDLIFYCKSRGIPEATAHALLIESFVGEAIDKVEAEPVRPALMEIARQWLKQGAVEVAGSPS